MLPEYGGQLVVVPVLPRFWSYKVLQRQVSKRWLSERPQNEHADDRDWPAFANEAADLF